MARSMRQPDLFQEPNSDATALFYLVLPATGFALTSAHPTSRPSMLHTAHSPAGPHSLPHHSVTMLSGKASLVLDDRPDLFVGELIPEPDHRRTGRAVLDHPEDFTLRPVAPESMVLKITRRGIETHCGHAVA